MKGRRSMAALAAFAIAASGIAAWATAQRTDEALQDVGLRNQRIHDSVINGGNVDESDLYGVRLRALTIDESTIENAAVSNATILRSDVSNAVLYQVTVEDSDIRGAWIERARVSGGTVRDASARDTTFENARLCRVTFVDEGRIDDSGCDGAPTPAPPSDDDDDDDDDAPTRTIVLENGGAGPSFDVNNYRGKVFPNDLSPGTVTRLCIFARDAGTFADVAVAASPGAPVQFEERIDVTQDRAWNCKDVSRPFAGDALFLFKRQGDASIGYDASPPTDSRYSTDNGATWGTDSWRRGYRVVLEVPG